MIIILCVSSASIIGQIIFNVEYSTFTHTTDPTNPNSTFFSPTNEASNFNLYLYDIDNNTGNTNSTVNVPNGFILLGFHQYEN